MSDPGASAPVPAPGPELVVGVGGNVGTEPELVARFERARDALTALGAVRSARLYRTAPIGPAQPPFLNTALAIAVAPERSPVDLLALVLALERSLGRARAAETRWGPRPLDLDLLVWGARTVHLPGLELPHPRLRQRRFALAPLADLLGPAFVIPGDGALAPALAAVADQGLEVVAERW